MLINLVGIVGGLLLAASGIPQAVRSWRDGHSEGIEAKLIFMLLGGISCFWIYLYAKMGYDLIIHTEYTVTILVWLVVLKYKFFKRH